MSRLEYLLKQHESLRDWYKQSEDKAKFLVTVNTLVVGVVNGLVFVGADKFRTVRPIYTTPIWILLGLSGIALVGSYLFILRAMWPRHHTRDASLKDSRRIWFFGDIASMSREDHTAAVGEWSEQAFEEALIAQSHILSTNVWTKHEALNRAIALTIVALILLFVLGVAYAIAIASTPL